MSFVLGLLAGLAAALTLALRFTDLGAKLRRHWPALRGGAAGPTLGEEIDARLANGGGDKKDEAMLGGLIGLRDLEVEDVMIHRTKMETLDAATPPDQLIGAILKSGFTRFPAWRDSPDNIVGIIHAKDVMAALQAQGGDAGKIVVDALLQPPWFVPGTRAAESQLRAFLRRKRQLAVVVDEYGEVMGLVTLEDILEEIVGDIADEHDTVASGVRQQKDGSYVIDGAAPIRDLNRSLGWSLPDDEATTLAGLVIHEARQIPDVGQVFTFHNFRFEVLRKRKNQITQVRAAPLSETIP